MKYMQAPLNFNKILHFQKPEILLLKLTWLAPSKPLASPPEERPQGSSWLPRPQGSPPPPPEESRSPTGTVLYTTA